MRVVVTLRVPAEVGCFVERRGEVAGTVVGCERQEGGLYAVTLEVSEELGKEMAKWTPGCSVGTKESGD